MKTRRNMLAILGGGWASALMARVARPAVVEHARIRLVVKTPRDEQVARVDQTPPASGKNPRPVARARVGEEIRVAYEFTNTYPNKVLKDVVVHFYVARIDRPGQPELPALGDENRVVLESAIDMDFRPGGHSGARSRFQIQEPGTYLVRVESLQTDSDHEHFSAIDLVIEPA